MSGSHISYPPGGAGIPAGSNTQVQYNNSGSFGASSNLTYDGTRLQTNNLRVYGANATVDLFNTNDSLTKSGYFSLTYDSFQFGYVDSTNLLYVGKLFLGGVSTIATTHQLNVLAATDLANILDDGAGNMTLSGSFTIKEAGNIILGTTTGTKIGTAITQKLGFFNATPVVRQTDGAALTNSVTVGGTTDTIADFSSLSVYATDAATIRNDIYQLARKLKIVDDALRTYGLLS